MEISHSIWITYDKTINRHQQTFFTFFPVEVALSLLYENTCAWGFACYYGGAVSYSKCQEVQDTFTKLTEKVEKSFNIFLSYFYLKLLIWNWSADRNQSGNYNFREDGILLSVGKMVL